MDDYYRQYGAYYGGNGEMGMAPATTAAGKRDRRRQTISNRLGQIEETFEAERDLQYREMLHGLQTTLSSLHGGVNPEFLEEVADIEEKRDYELTRLELWEQYQIDRTLTEYQREVEQAEQEYKQMMQMVRDRLVGRLEAQRKKLREDKALLDIANDHSVFLDSQHQGNGNGTTLLAPGSPGLDRRNTRRRGENTHDELSGMSGAETTATTKSRRGGGGRSGAGNKSTAGPSDIEGLSDRDLEGVLFARERDAPSTRHTSRSFQGVSVLKADDALQDLALIRSSNKRKR
jgi:hypothetical protein